MGGTLRLRRRKDVFARHRSNYYYLKKPLVNQFKTPELKLISENKQLYQCKFKWEEKQHKVTISNA